MGSASDDGRSREELLAENNGLRERLALLEQGANKALRQSQAQLHTAIDSMPFDFFLIDADGRYALQNRICLRRWGDVIGKRPEDLDASPKTHALWKDNNRRAFAGESVVGEETLQLEGESRHYYNIISPILDGSEVLGILGINVDMTDRKQLELTRLRLSKLESLGMLAGGIAHDFNNILTGIMGNLSLALSEGAEPAEVSSYLAVAEEACQRATGLTEQLLTFAKGGTPIRENTVLGSLIEEACRFALQGSNCRCEVDLQPDLYPACVDRGQIAQVIQNLALNAAQAMPEGGVVTLSAHNRQLAGANPAGLAPGRYVSISLTDEGAGIEADMREHIFDPYFSTKPKGHGLGLAVVHSIVMRHGGHVKLRSKLGQGTTFEVLLEAGLESGRGADSPAPLTTAGSGRVLFLDDQADLRSLASNMLMAAGYDPEVTASCAQTVAAYREAMRAELPFVAVILDLTIPGEEGGLQCLQVLLDLDPEVRAIVTSGYSHDPVMADPAGHGFRAVLRKPFRLRDLTEALQRALV